MRGVYREDVWIPSQRAAELAKDLRSFLRAYIYSARLSFEHSQYVQFPLFPKLHALHEVSYEMTRQARVASFVLNPAIEICGPDEDFVGRIAALSRCCSPRLIALRTLQRYLAQIQVAWSRI